MEIFRKNFSILGDWNCYQLTSDTLQSCAKSLIYMKNWQSRVQQSDLRRVYSSFEEVMEMGMTPTQKEVFLVIDEFWKKFGYSPSIKDIAYVRGKMGIGNTHKIVNRLVKLGAVKKVKGMARSIRPVYVNFKNME